MAIWLDCTRSMWPNGLSATRQPARPLHGERIEGRSRPGRRAARQGDGRRAGGWVGQPGPGAARLDGEGRHPALGGSRGPRPGRRPPRRRWPARRPGRQGERCRRRPRRASGAPQGNECSLPLDLAASAATVGPEALQSEHVVVEPVRGAEHGTVRLQAPPVSVKMPTTPPRATSRRDQRCTVGRMATASMVVTPQRGATRPRRAWRRAGSSATGSARRRAPRSRRSRPALPQQCPQCRRARRERAASAPGRNWGFQVAPPSSLCESGEKRSSRSAGTRPAIDPAGVPATSPPLSAAPGGVTTDQCEEPGAARRSCQNVLDRTESSPMGSMTHDPPTSTVALSGARTGRPRRRRGAGRDESPMPQTISEGGPSADRPACRTSSARAPGRSRTRTSSIRPAAATRTTRRRSGRPRVVDEGVTLLTLRVDDERQVTVGDHGAVRDGLDENPVGVPGTPELRAANRSGSTSWTGASGLPGCRTPW